MSNLVGTIIAPQIPEGLPEDVQWLSGQGGGTWFHISATTNARKYLIQRFSAKGKKECERNFTITDSTAKFNICEEYRFVHISHCAKCRIKQGNTIFIFNYDDDQTK